MPEHNVITDPELHEPKGISTATAGQILVADGAASGAWTDVIGSKTVLVSVKADLPTPSAGVITLVANTEYRILGDIDLGTDRLVMANGTIVTGIDNFLSSLTYTGTGDMFTGVDAQNRISNLSISCANGRVINWSVTASPKLLVFADVVITIADQLGTFVVGATSSTVRLSNLTVLTATTDGFDFSGTFNVLFIDVLFLVNLAAGTFLDLGTATFAAVIITQFAATLASGSFFLSGAAASANIASGGIGSVVIGSFSGAGTPLNTITVDDALWQFAHNDDIADTRPDGLNSLTANATNTVIATQSVPVLAAGTWVVERTSQMTGTTAGRLTYNGGKDATVPITARVSLEPASGTNKLLGVTIAKNGTTIPNSLSTATTNAGTPTSVTCVWQLVLSTGDFVEVFLSNETDTIDVLGSSAILRVN
jgi:hypothetical protein